MSGTCIIRNHAGCNYLFEFHLHFRTSVPRGRSVQTRKWRRRQFVRTDCRQMGKAMFIIFNMVVTLLPQEVILNSSPRKSRQSIPNLAKSSALSCPTKIEICRLLADFIVPEGDTPCALKLNQGKFSPLVRSAHSPFADQNDSGEEFCYSYLFFPMDLMMRRTGNCHPVFCWRSFWDHNLESATGITGKNLSEFCEMFAISEVSPTKLPSWDDVM